MNKKNPANEDSSEDKADILEDHEQQLLRIAEGIETLKALYEHETDPVRQQLLYRRLADATCV